MRRCSSVSSVLMTAVAALIMLGGCLPSPPRGAGADALADQIRALTGGECFGETSDGDLAFDKQVPCDEPHPFEVLRTVEVPPELSGVSRADALDRSSDANHRIMEYVLPLCIAELVDATGLDAVANRVPLLEGAALWPGIAGGATVHGPPEAVWDETHLVVCTAFWTDITGARIDVESRTEEPVLESFGSPAASEAMRVCMNLQDGGYLRSPCSQAHYAETLFQFDAALALGDSWVAGVDPAAVTAEQFGTLDSLCDAVAPAVFDAERTAADVAILAELLPQTWGVPMVSGGSYPVFCVAVPTDPALLLDGPVWGLGDEPATLVPAT